MESVRKERKARGWSQQRLADEAGINKVTLVHIETGKSSPNVETLEKLASALGIRVAEFFKDEPEYTYPPKADDPVGLPIRLRWLPSTLDEAVLPTGSILLERTGHAYLDWRVGDLEEEARRQDEAGILQLLHALEEEERVMRQELNRQYRRQRRSREYKSRIRQLQHLFTTRVVALAETANAQRVVAEAERILEESGASV